ncbi:MAG: hypothetical protein ACKOVH_02420 [Actinomycetota bacterium]
MRAHAPSVTVRFDGSAYDFATSKRTVSAPDFASTGIAGKNWSNGVGVGSAVSAMEYVSTSHRDPCRVSTTSEIRSSNAVPAAVPDSVPDPCTRAVFPRCVTLSAAKATFPPVAGATLNVPG